MPNFFAHYMHGQNVLKALPKKISKKITNRKLFEIGLQGPDIFYPYKALAIFNTFKVNKLGSKIHRKSGRKFMNKLFKNTEVKPSGELFSYVCGFICHFALDSSCHPYINAVAAKNAFTHGEIEMEFDRILLLMEGKDPLTTDFSKLIKVSHIKSREIKEIARAFKGYKRINEKVIARTLKDFRFFKKFFYSPSQIKQEVLHYICSVFMLSRIYNSCVMQTNINPKSFITNGSLLFLFNDSIADAVELICNFHDHIIHDTPFSKKFDRKFN